MARETELGIGVQPQYLYAKAYIQRNITESRVFITFTVQPKLFKEEENVIHFQEKKIINKDLS